MLSLEDIKLLIETFCNISEKYGLKVKNDDMELNKKVRFSENSYLSIAQFTTTALMAKLCLKVSSLCWFFSVFGIEFIWHCYSKYMYGTIGLIGFFVTCFVLIRAARLNRRFLDVFSTAYIASWFPIKHPVKFMLSNNFVANVAVVFTIIANALGIGFSCIMYAFYYKMEGLVTVANEQVNKESFISVSRSLQNLSADLYSLRITVFVIYAAVCFILVAVVIWAGYGLRTKKKEIYSFNLNLSSKNVPDTVNYDGVVIFKMDGQSYTMNFDKYELTFLSDAVIVKEADSFIVDFLCRSKDLEKITITGIGINKELTFDPVSGKWCVQ